MISVIIPTLNEASNIRILIPKLSKILKKYRYEMIIVDDNSFDGTYDVAKQLAKKYKVRPILRLERKDLSLSVLEGLKKAKGDIIAVMDADLSHPPEMLPKLIKQLDYHDLVIGSRIIKGGKVEDWPIHRYLVSYVARLMARPLTAVNDSLSGFFVMKKKVIKGVSLKPRGYKILLEILVKGKYNSIKEISYVFRNRDTGDSNISIMVYYNYLRHLASLYRYKLI